MLHHILRMLEMLRSWGQLQASSITVSACAVRLDFCASEKAAGEAPALDETEGDCPLHAPGFHFKTHQGHRSGNVRELSQPLLAGFPEYEIIFGVSDRRRSRDRIDRSPEAEFPRRPIRSLVCTENLGANTKVSNLAQMLLEAKYEYISSTTATSGFSPDYLRRVIGSAGRSKSVW